MTRSRLRLLIFVGALVVLVGAMVPVVIGRATATRMDLLDERFGAPIARIGSYQWFSFTQNGPKNELRLHQVSAFVTNTTSSRDGILVYSSDSTFKLEVREFIEQERGSDVFVPFFPAAEGVLAIVERGRVVRQEAFKAPFVVLGAGKGSSP